MRTLAIDPGARRVGLALSDSSGKLASPYDVLNITSPTQAIEKILTVISEEQVERIVIGLPLNMDGSSGPAAKISRDWGKEIATRTGKPVLYVDERLSSFQAEQNLTARRKSGEKITRSQKKSRLDAQAAAIFLQDFLDQKLTAHSE